MHTNLSPAIRMLGRTHGVNIILSIATAHWLQVLIHRDPPGDLLGFLAELAQLLRTQDYEVSHVRDEPSYLNVIAQRADH